MNKIAILFARDDSRYKELGGGTMYMIFTEMLETIVKVIQLLHTHLVEHGEC